MAGTADMTPEQVAATDSRVPRIRVADEGSFWAWSGINGRHSRPKTMPPLPALHTEDSHGRWWQRTVDSTRTVLRLPPDWP